MLELLGFAKGLRVLESDEPSTNDEDIPSGVSSGMLPEESPLPKVVNWEVRQEELVSGAWAAVGNEQSLRAGHRFWSSFTILLEPLQTCPGTALGQLYQPCERQHGQYLVISPAGLVLKRL